MTDSVETKNGGMDPSTVEKGIVTLLLAVMIFKLIGVFYSFSAQGLSVKRAQDPESEDEDEDEGPAGTSGYGSEDDEGSLDDVEDEDEDDEFVDEGEDEDEDWDRIDGEETRRAYYKSGEADS